MKKNKKNILIITILILIIILSSFTINSIIQLSQEQLTKSHSFGEFDLTRTTTITFSNRIEEYEFTTKNPVIAYLIIPKSITTHISQIKISGDFEAKIIEEDPIILIQQKNYSPGIKKMTITAPIGKKNHTAIILPFDLVNYETMTLEEKIELETMITQLKNIEEKYYEQEEVNKIIEEFIFLEIEANLKNLTENKEGKKIYFEEEKPLGSKFFEIFSTLTSGIIDKRIKEPQIQTNTIEETRFTVEIPKLEYLKIPKDINLYLDKNNNSYSTKILFDNPKKIKNNEIPLVEIEPHPLSEFIKTNLIKNKERKNELSLTISLNQEEMKKYTQETEENLNLTLSYYLKNKINIKLNVYFNKSCENRLEKLFEENEYLEEEKNEMEKKCEESQPINFETIIEEYLTQFLNYQNKITKLPEFLIKEGDRVDLEECKEGCIIKTNSTTITKTIEEEIKQENNTTFIPEGETVSILVSSQLNQENIQEFNEDAVVFSYSCNSPCVWNSNPEVIVNNFGNISIAYTDSVTPAKITGILQKSLIENINFVPYSKESNLTLPNNEATNYLNQLKKEKKTIFIIYPTAVNQAIKVYSPDGMIKNLENLYLAMKKRKPILLNNTTANTKNNCALYVRLFAKTYFGKEYKPGHAWVFAKENKSLYRANFDKKTKTGGITKAQFEAFAGENKFIKPGTVIGVFYPRSNFNLPTIPYTHVIIYLGKDKNEHLFAENFNGPRITSLDKAMNTYHFVEIIEPKEN